MKPENVFNMAQVKYKVFHKAPLTITYLLQFTIIINISMRSIFQYYSLALIDIQYDATLSFFAQKLTQMQNQLNEIVCD